MSTAALFDHLAPRYDALWTNTAVGRAQRSAVWRIVDDIFQPGEHLLDVGCGTGEDAAHFAARRLLVHAVDRSAPMVECATRRGGFQAEVLEAEELATLAPQSFDGAISNFGALNCVADLAAVARSLGALVRPGGRVAICMLGRLCAWEMLYYGARLDFRKAFRRLPGSTGEIRYPTVRQLRAAFAPDFKLLRWTGIGMLVPPSYVKFPAPLVNAFAAADRVPLLRSWADHRLLIFERK